MGELGLIDDADKAIAPFIDLSNNLIIIPNPVWACTEIRGMKQQNKSQVVMQRTQSCDKPTLRGGSYQWPSPALLTKIKKKNIDVRFHLWH